MLQAVDGRHTRPVRAQVRPENVRCCTGALNENARIMVAGVFLTAVSFDQIVRLRRANPTPARPRPSRASAAGSGTELGSKVDE
jgi:hypothetical protein